MLLGRSRLSCGGRALRSRHRTHACVVDHLDRGVAQNDGASRFIRSKSPLCTDDVPEPNHSRLLALIQTHIHHGAELREELRDGSNRKLVGRNAFHKYGEGSRSFGWNLLLSGPLEFGLLLRASRRSQLLLILGRLLILLIREGGLLLGLIIHRHFLNFGSLVHLLLLLLLLLLHNSVMFCLLHLLVIRHCRLQLLLDHHVVWVHLMLLLQMKQRVHEALLIGSLVLVHTLLLDYRLGTGLLLVVRVTRQP